MDKGQDMSEVKMQWDFEDLKFERYKQRMREKPINQNVLMATVRKGGRQINVHQILDVIQDDEDLLDSIISVTRTYWRFCFLIEMKNTADKDLFKAKKLVVQEEELTLIDLREPEFELKLHWVTQETSEEEITQIFEKNGFKVTSPIITEFEIRKGRKIDVGVRKIMLKESSENVRREKIPEYITFGDNTILCQLEGKRKKCQDCGSEAHRTGECEMRCQVCDSESHHWKKCPSTREVKEKKKDLGQLAFPTIQEAQQRNEEWYNERKKKKLLKKNKEKEERVNNTKKSEEVDEVSESRYMKRKANLSEESGGETPDPKKGRAGSENETESSSEKEKEVQQQTASKEENRKEEESNQQEEYKGLIGEIPNIQMSHRMNIDMRNCPHGRLEKETEIARSLFLSKVEEEAERDKSITKQMLEEVIKRLMEDMETNIQYRSPSTQMVIRQNENKWFRQILENVSWKMKDGQKIFSKFNFEA